MPSWHDYVADIESLEGTERVNPDKENWQMTVGYSRSESHFHQATEYRYTVVNNETRNVPLRVEPSGDN